MVGPFANFGRHLSHFGDTAGVVSDRPISIHSQLDAGIRQHPDGRDRDAVQTGQFVSSDNGCSDQNDGNRCRHHADAQAGNDVRCCSCDRLTNDLFHRRLAGVVFGDQADQQSAAQTNQRCQEHAHPSDFAATVLPGRGHQAHDHGQAAQQHYSGGNQFAAMQCLLWIVRVFTRDKEGTGH